MQGSAVATQRAFGFLFVCVSIAVGVASVISEIAYLNNLPLYSYAIIWIGSFAAVFGGGFKRFQKAVPMIKSRMETSSRWPFHAKAINGLCWAGPFAAIAVFPALYQYLILLGIGFGNLSTYFLIKKYNKANNHEQFIVAAISLASVPVAVIIDSSLFASHQDIAVMVSRILIALSYAVGGVFALFRKAGPVGFDPTTSGSLQ